MFLLSASRLADMSALSSYTFCYNFRRGCVEVGPVSVWLKRWARVLLSIVIGTGCWVSVGTRWACPHVVRHKSPERNAQALHHTTYCTFASLRNTGALAQQTIHPLNTNDVVAIPNEERSWESTSGS